MIYSSRERNSRLTILVVFVLFANLNAPSWAQRPNHPITAQKFDEFGDIDHSDLIARLDNFAVMLTETNDPVGFILVYRSRRDLPGLSHSLAIKMRDYLLNSRGIPRNRIAIVDGGVADHLVQELWIVPKGSAPTPREDARIGYFYWPDEAWKFWEYGYLPRELYRRYGVDRTFDSDADYLEAFANAIKQKPNNIGCVIAYAQYNPKKQLVDWVGDYEPRVDVRLDPRYGPKQTQSRTNPFDQNVRYSWVKNPDHRWWLSEAARG